MSLALDKSSIFEALKKSHHAVLRRLQVEKTDSSLIITGQVSSYFLKQLAQETIRPHLGSLKVINRVTVANNSDEVFDRIHN